MDKAVLEAIVKTVEIIGTVLTTIFGNDKK